MKSATKASKKKYSRIDEKRFNAVKGLINAGIKTSKIMETMEMSNSSIYTIKRCESFGNYREYVEEQTAKLNARNLAKMAKKEAIVPTSDEMAQDLEQSLLEKVFSQNTEILEKLQWVEENAVIKEPRRLFTRR